MSKTNNNLDTQTPYLWIILGRQNSPLKEDFNAYYEKLSAWCKINAKLWAFIGHDKDENEDGTPKFRHIHALIVLKDGVKPRLSTSLNRISQVCGIDTIDIDIEKADNITSCIQYCVHKGYPNKYPYPIEDLQTNLTDDDLKEYLNTEESAFTANYLINLIVICNYSVVTILRQIGLKTYCRYRGVIKDIIEEFKEDR